MKKVLLLIICALCVALLHAQNQGYFWYFNTAPFNSIPATAGSTGSYTLTTIGTGSITPGTNDNIVLGDCNGNFPTGTYTKPFGLVFSNNPSYVGDTYTISMVFEYTDQGPPHEWKRILNFENPAVQNPYYGAFIASGQLNFYQGFGAGTYITANIFPINTYFQLDFVRDGTTKLITCYKNAVQVGTYPDNADIFKPKASGNFGISFFKGFFNEESSGRVVKIGIFNYMLTPQQIQQNFANICDPAFIILPVTLKEFIAKIINNRVELSWTTSSEQNNRGFEIQRSSDGIIFSRIGWMDGLGNSSTEHSYQFRDIAPLKGKSLYRLAQTDLDGRINYSPVRKVDFGNPIDIDVFPNPAATQLTIQFTDQSEKEIMITDMLGRNVWSRKNVLSLSVVVPLQQLTTGIYMVHVRDNNGNLAIQKFIKN